MYGMSWWDWPKFMVLSPTLLVISGFYLRWSVPPNEKCHQQWEWEWDIAGHNGTHGIRQEMAQSHHVSFWNSCSSAVINDKPGWPHPAAFFFFFEQTCYQHGSPMETSFPDRRWATWKVWPRPWNWFWAERQRRQPLVCPVRVAPHPKKGLAFRWNAGKANKWHLSPRYGRIDS